GVARIRYARLFMLQWSHRIRFGVPRLSAKAAPDRSAQDAPQFLGRLTRTGTLVSQERIRWPSISCSRGHRARRRYEPLWSRESPSFSASGTCLGTAFRSVHHTRG